MLLRADVCVCLPTDNLGYYWTHQPHVFCPRLCYKGFLTVELIHTFSTVYFSDFFSYYH